MTNLQAPEAAVEVTQGSSPVILGFPHTGTYVPDTIRQRLNDTGLALADTDWHVFRLFEDLLTDATMVRATFSRYVIDANRDPEGKSLYPGQNTTTLIPQTDFDEKPIWREGQAPTQRDTEERLAQFHRPYHQAIEQEIARIRAIHGMAVVFDCHSIRSYLPFLFDGVPPDINLGTDCGRTCDTAIEKAAATSAQTDDFSQVVNGRFRGGWTTRHYGQPQNGVHAIQVELAQSTYLICEQAPFDYAPEKADRLRGRLREMLTNIETTAGELPR